MEIDLSFSFENIDKLFAETLANAVAKPIKPNREHWACSILIPEGFKWKKVIVNSHPEDFYRINIFDMPFTLIKHGHPESQQFCLWENFCHAYGYKPTGKESRTFLEGFYKKWPYLANTNP